MTNSQQTNMGENFTEIPIVDLSEFTEQNADRQRLADKLSDICHNIGFFVVVNHGVPAQLIDETFAMSRKLFALPLEDKQRIKRGDSRHFRGWEGEGTELTNNQPDMREQVDLWTEHTARSKTVKPGYLRLLGPNQWLPESVLPNYRQTLDTWFAAVGELADQLMQLLALGLELPEDYFDKQFGDERMSMIKLIRYPETPANHFGVGAHNDSGFLTVLAAGETPGLQIKNSAGNWIPVPIIPGSFVINLGEMLQAITGNYFVATKHRVFTNAERYSISYFHGPSLNTVLDPAPLKPAYFDAVKNSPYHTAAGFMANPDEMLNGEQQQSSTYGEHLWRYLSRSYPDDMQKFYPS